MLLSLVSPFGIGATPLPPVPLIIDTDMGGGGCRDVDDVAAVCMAAALARRGEAKLLAVMHNTKPAVIAGVTSSLLTYYGMQKDVPLGVYRGGVLQDDVALPYTTDLARNWPSPVKNASQCREAVDLYRQILAAQPDRSVVISSIGLLTNLDALLASSPDAHSPLNGTHLVAKKVRRVAIMGGGYPHTTSRATGASGRFAGGACECNFCAAYNGGLDHAAASEASSRVVAALPPTVEVIFSGVEVGLRVVTGARLSRCAPPSSPCRQAFLDYEGGPSKGRFSWDPLTTLAAVRGPGGVACTVEASGANTVDPASGGNRWVDGTPRNESYLILRDAHAAGQAIDELLCESPRSSL